MILSAQNIRMRCQSEIRTPYIDPANHGWETQYRVKKQHPLITPFSEREVQNGKSFGLSSAGYDIRVGLPEKYDGAIRMQNGDFLLAYSLERIKMPNDLICIVHDKSSWAREGLALQNTVLEPGWEGYITLEITFHRPAHHVVIKHGDPIAQLIFHYLDEPTKQPYEGKYQDQPAKAIEAIREGE